MNGRNCSFLDQLPARGGLWGLARLELAGGQLVDVTARGVAELAQQADAVLGIDGDHGGAAGMPHDLERNTNSCRQLDLVDAHLDHASAEDFISFEQHARSVLDAARSGNCRASLYSRGYQPS